MENNNARIAKNTLFLYFRMFATMIVSLYTSRVVLDVLGVDDFGIYNIVGSIVVLFSFLSNSLTGASQRFFSFELGKKEESNLCEVFSICVSTHILLIGFIVLISETLGLWFLYNKINIPSERLDAAVIVYQLSLLTFLFNMIRIPFNALIIAHEDMSFFAIVSIVEVVLKLIIVFALLVLPFDKLIVYGILMLLVTIICTYAYMYFCKKKYDESKFHLIVDRRRYKKLLDFIGWTLCGNVANVSAQQGGNILLNIFYGVSVNTAFGLSNQVSGVINGFVTNFQMAFRPQIVKYYASGDKTDLNSLVFRSSRLSFYLLLLIAVPFVVNADFIFSLWLKDVPDYSVDFCQIMMFYFLIDAIQAPLWMMIDATGNIKSYALWLSAILLLNLPIAYVCLRLGCSPIVVLVIRVIINLVTAIVRTLYIKHFLGFPSMEYIRNSIPCILIGIISFGMALSIKKISFFIYPELFSIVFSIIIVFILIYYFGLKKEERRFVKELIKK